MEQDNKLRFTATTETRANHPAPEDYMQSLIDFLSAYRPLFAQVVKGHPPEEIERYERALGVPLPSVYRDFMSTMGDNSGLMLRNYFIIDELIEHVDEKRKLLENMSYQLIPASVDLEGDQDYYIHLGRPMGHGDGHYVCSFTGTSKFSDIHVAPSFRDALFYNGFLQVRMLDMHQVNIMWYEVELRAVKSMLERLGFRDLEVVGPIRSLWERGDCAAAVSKHWLGWEIERTGEGLHRPCAVGVGLGAHTRQTLETVLETLRDNIHGKTWIWGREYLDRP